MDATFQSWALLSALLPRIPQEASSPCSSANNSRKKIIATPYELLSLAAHLPHRKYPCIQASTRSASSKSPSKTLLIYVFIMKVSKITYVVTILFIWREDVIRQYCLERNVFRTTMYFNRDWIKRWYIKGSVETLEGNIECHCLTSRLDNGGVQHTE